jgi:hypothetical protein
MDPKAYRNDDDPSIIYVVVPGGHFAALRIDGKWKHNISMTMGHLEDNYRLIEDPAEVACLFKAARTSTVPKPLSPRTSDYDPDEADTRSMINTLKRRQAEREAKDPKRPSRETYDYDEVENKGLIEALRRINAKREAKDK